MGGCHDIGDLAQDDGTVRLQPGEGAACVAGEDPPAAKQGQIGLAVGDLKNGLYPESPLLKQLLGLCSSLAVSTTLFSAVSMGAAVIATLVVCNIVVSLLRNAIPEDVRLPMKIVVIATTVTIVDQTMGAFAPAAHKVLGVYLPLIVVNCIILGRAEAFAHAHGVVRSIGDALGQGMGYAVILALLGTVREILGSGSLLGIPLFGAGFEPILLMAQPGGAFFLMGLVLGTASLYDHVRARAADRAARAAELAGVGLADAELAAEASA